MKKAISMFMSLVMLFGIMAVPAYAANGAEISARAVVGGEAILPNAGVITTFSKYTAYELNTSKTDVKTPDGFTKGSTSTGTYVETEVVLGKMTAKAIRNLVKQRYISALISAIGAVPQGTMSSLIEEGFTDAEIQKIKEANPNSKNINYKITTYNKSGNNSLYSVHLYGIRLYGNASCTGIPAISMVKKVTEAT